jgi:hypothetical protein
VSTKTTTLHPPAAATAQIQGFLKQGVVKRSGAVPEFRPGKRGRELLMVFVFALLRARMKRHAGWTLSASSRQPDRH